MKKETKEKKTKDQLFWEDFVVRNDIKKKPQLTVIRDQKN